MFNALYRAQAPLPETLSAFIDQQESCPNPTSSTSPISQNQIASQITDIDNEQSNSKYNFKPSERYKMKLLKFYVKKVEGKGGVVEGDEFTKLMFETMMSNKSNALEPDLEVLSYLSFEHFKLGSSPLGIRINPRHNDVGLRVWEGAYFLSEFFIENPHLVKNKKVVELGAGCGLTGLVVSNVCEAKSVHMTDYTTDTIENLKHNVKINENEDGISVGFLDWVQISEIEDLDVDNSSSESVKKLVDADVLLAADCVYDVEFIPHLVCAVEKVLQLGVGDRVEEKVAYFATTLRNEETFELFINQVKSKNIRYKTLTFNAEDEETQIFQCFHTQKRSEIKLHEFRL